jgi:hypothetical protein
MEAAYRIAVDRAARGLPVAHIGRPPEATARPVQPATGVNTGASPAATGDAAHGSGTLTAQHGSASEVSQKQNGKPFLISLYLPQFHPIPENDEWWGKGFTEWTNVAKATPLYPEHYQPHVPADLGFYDLRLSETREAQAAMARAYGVDAFCYYHYWFAGRRILERPFNEMLASGRPDFPFLACWANESWSGVWHGSPDKVLILQTYPGVEDYIRHFHAMLPAFRDRRYVKVNGKPMFVVWAPTAIPNPRQFADLWRELALKAGLPGLHLVGAMPLAAKWSAGDIGFDASLPLFMPKRIISTRGGKRYPTTYKYEAIYEQFIPSYPADGKTYPCVKPNWDNTPRCGVNGLVFEDATPEIFRKQFQKALKWSAGMPENNRVIFIKAWNEWAEGNYLEPDIRYGHQFLNVIKSSLDNNI